MAQPDRAGFNIESRAALLEVNTHSLRFSCIHQSSVQCGARNRMDHLSIVFSIRLEGKLAGHRVHHSALHGDDDLTHYVPQSRPGKSMNSTRRQREVNGTSSTHGYATHVRPAFVNLNAEAALYQGRCKQGTVQSGADQCDCSGSTLHGRLSLIWACLREIATDPIILSTTSWLPTVPGKISSPA